MSKTKGFPLVAALWQMGDVAVRAIGRQCNTHKNNEGEGKSKSRVGIGIELTIRKGGGAGKINLQANQKDHQHADGL